MKTKNAAKNRKRSKSPGQPEAEPLPAGDHMSKEPESELEPSGRLQPIAAKILMKILYGARMARYDLLRAICYLATCVTKWTQQCDRDLHRLVCYLKTTQHYKQISWVGDDITKIHMECFADADFAGCVRTQRRPVPFPRISLPRLPWQLKPVASRGGVSKW